MKKMKFLVVVLLAAVLSSCGNNSGNETANTDTTEVKTDTTVAAIPDVTAVTFADLTDSLAMSLAGKEVKIQGTVDHVCKHGGKRLMLVGQNPDERIRVEAGDNPPFDQELTGKTIEVTGKLMVEKIDSTYLANWEKELKENKADAKKLEGEHHIGGKELAENEENEKEEAEEGNHDEVKEQMEQISRIREMISKNGKGYILNKYIELKEYKEVQ